jgi:hypothetical protein
MVNQGSRVSFLPSGFATAPDAFSIALTIIFREVKHGVTQKPIRLGLITRAIGFEPCNDIGVQAYGDGPFSWAMELPDLGPAPIENRGSVRKINVLVSFYGAGLYVSFLFLCELPHRLSFRVIPPHERRNSVSLLRKECQYRCMYEDVAVAGIGLRTRALLTGTDTGKSRERKSIAYRYGGEGGI